MYVESGVVVVDSTNDVLSLRYPATFKVLRNRFFSAWHHILYMKAMRLQLFGTADRILAVEDPDDLDALAAPMTHADQRRWLQKVRFDLVAANSNKFQASADMLAVLLGTGAQLIVSTTHPGTLWSAPVPAEGTSLSDKATWIGCNIEGIALMRTRDLLTPSADFAVFHHRSAESPSLRTRINECWGWDPEFSALSEATYEDWIAQIRVSPPGDVISELHDMMRRRYWDVDIEDPARADFVSWVRSELKLELPPDPTLLRGR